MPIKQIHALLQIKWQIIKQYVDTLSLNLNKKKSAIQTHPAFLKFIHKPLHWLYDSRSRRIKNYINKFVNVTVEAAILVIIIFLLCYILLYLAEIMWYLYLSTLMGYKFLKLFPERAQTIIEISDLDLLYFSADLTLSVFVFCIVISSICRFLHINHFLYHSRGLFGKLVLWGIPLTAVCAYFIKHRYEFSGWEVTCVVVMIPTYLMFISCFKYTEKILPELGDLIRPLIPSLKKLYRLILSKIREITGIEFPGKKNNQEDNYGM